MRKITWITKEFLHREYIELMKSSEVIGKEFGISGRAVRDHLSKHGFDAEMKERKSIVNIGREPATKGKKWEMPHPRKGVTTTNNPAQGRYYVHSNGRNQPRARVVMEEYLGRPLLPGEVVHHGPLGALVDTIDNLFVISSQSEHMKMHRAELRAKGQIRQGGGQKKTHCIRGHEFTPENTHVSPKGGRFCLECRKYHNNKKRKH
jgi:hypothetical protein